MCCKSKEDAHILFHRCSVRCVWCSTEFLNFKDGSAKRASASAHSPVAALHKGADNQLNSLQVFRSVCTQLFVYEAPTAPSRAFLKDFLSGQYCMIMSDSL